MGLRNGKKLAARTLSGLFARGGDDKLTHVQDFEKTVFGDRYEGKGDKNAFLSRL